MWRLTDFIINLLRWPTALILIVFTPALAMSYRHFNFYTLNFLALGCGVFVFCFSAMASGYNIRHAMQIIAHELTHSLFAILTLHKVSNIRLNPDESGGSMMLKGKGNWLITLSPYFFPLPAFVYMLIMPFFVSELEGMPKFICYAVLGYFLAYYWSTVLSQVHKEQTDIIREGYLFSAIIIVSLNLFVTGAIFAYCSKSWSGIATYCRLILKLTTEYIEQTVLLF